MRSLLRASAVSAAFLPAVLLLSFVGARAQSAPTPFAQAPRSPSASPWVIHVSPPFTVQSVAPQQAQPSATDRLPRLSPQAVQNLVKKFAEQKLGIIAVNERPCYALRTYGFTTSGDGASAPQLTSYKTCTVASQTHFKELVVARQPTK